MLKKIGLSVVVLAAMLLVAIPSPAGAQVRFGITFGTPGYVYVNPVNPYAYGYYSPYSYYYPQPYYRYPWYVSPYSYGRHDHDHYRDYDRHYRDHDRHERREHEFHERGEHSRGDGNHR